jgi:glycosyltransferase involved in cell wall biosynthesis
VKVLIVTFADGGGGAARAAYRLHSALRGAGVDSRMKVRVKTRCDASVSGPRGWAARIATDLRVRAGGALRRLQGGSGFGLRSPNLLPSRWARSINESGADVVNLHWLGADTMSVADIGRIEKPVVWTLHDMWAFCGAEHITDAGPSARWRLGYDAGNRPAGQLGLDLDLLVWRRKRSAWRRPFVLVTPSRWLGQCAAASALFSGSDYETIPNVLDTGRFAPADPAAARRALGLPEAGPIVLFGAHEARSDPNKGYDLLRDALAELDRLGLAPRPSCVAFGEAIPGGADAGPFPVRWVGRIDDDAELARLYSAADVTVVPSRIENLPQTATEAQACGCPVVAFATGGLPEAVEHGATGYLAAPFAPADLARGIAWVLADPERHAQLRMRARERAVRSWSPAVITPRYLDTFSRAIAAQPRGL